MHLGWHFDRDTDRLHAAGSTDTPEDRVLYAAENAWTMLHSGVTTVQSVGGPDDIPVRDAIAGGSLPEPRVLTSVRPVTEGTGGPDEIRAHIDEVAAAGADVIKIFASASIRVGGTPTMSQEQLDAACGQAQEVIELPGRDRLIEPEFEEVYCVGILEGESWEMFGQVNQVAFDAEGNLYVFDGTMGLLGSGNLRVLVFDATGGFLREFGSWGGGPGEFNRPTGFAVLRDGTMVVSDAGHRAYQLFDASGAFQRMVRTGDEPGSVSVSEGIQPDPRGGAVFTGAFGGGPGVTIASAGGGPVAPPTSRPVMRVGLDGEVVQENTVVGSAMLDRNGR